ncbi:MAG: hypothetical protein A3G77_09630 [Acidobacteria bacterium RIFCSPLOWO2_12_FULL_68_19]|nr:MAG: hypothetical protein A3G77_09630 [Acidobacteria bacterium RIFCSPLOWO2_12_FULL_68_19]
MPYSCRARCTVAAALAAVLSSGAGAQAPPAETKKPTIALRATPPVGFVPLRVRAAAELREGNDDYADFYCATIEWEWGDGTYSENTSDCNPYEAGKSTIQRRFSAEHIFRQGGVYRIVFRLKQKTRSVGSAITNVQVRSGAGEGFGR